MHGKYAGKARLRHNRHPRDNGRPVLITVSTNDALSASAKNIGTLLNIKNICFVPFRQDDFIKKPTSAVADFTKLPEAAAAALSGRQLQPILS